jgi:hypothetical protein
MDKVIDVRGYTRLLVLAAIAGTCLASSSAAAATGTCPNESARVGTLSNRLPDCRAYEMASPDFKDGSTIAGPGEQGPTALVATDGSNLLGGSLGAFAGTESDPYNGVAGAVYSLSRTGGGWTPTAASPPAETAPAQVFLGATPDLSTALWILRSPSESVLTGQLYLRQSGGQLTRVGPLVPPAYGEGPPGGSNFELLTGAVKPQYVGGSHALSRLFVSVRPGENTNVLWPGDTTFGFRHSLYEYAGTELSRPQLVGVNAEGKLVSNCGIELGGGEGGDKYNAISADGEKVFFTAISGGECATPTVNELYARINAVETVPLSEPTPLACYECQTGTKAAAEFQGASEDGSQAFFTTTQELLPGQTTSNLYEYDFHASAGHKIVLVSAGSPTPEVQGVARVSDDGSHVYFVAKAALTGPNGEGESPSAGGENLYVYEHDAAFPAGRLTFIATLAEADGQLWAEADLRPAQATPEGRYFVFVSDAKVTADNTSTVPQVFLYDAVEGKLVRISKGQDGYNNDGNTETDAAEIPEAGYSLADNPTEEPSHLALSANGSDVFFTTAGALTPEATEAAGRGERSVYEYHSAGDIAEGSVSLISDGKTEAKLIGTDASGEDVFIDTRAPLVGSDSNTQLDLYDARIAGGFALPASITPCVGEGCLGPAASLPSVVGNISEVTLAEPAAVEPLTKSKTVVPAKKPSQTLAQALRACKKLANKQKRKRCEANARQKHKKKQKAHKKTGSKH